MPLAICEQEPKLIPECTATPGPRHIPDIWVIFTVIPHPRETIPMLDGHSKVAIRLCFLIKASEDVASFVMGVYLRWL